MKRSVILMSVIVCILILLAVPVNAATFGISASTTQVSPNGTFSVSVGGDCIGRVNLSVSNGTLSTNSIWVEQGYQTVTVTAGSSGNVIVTATPTAGFSDSDANEYNPGARSTTVSISSPNNTTGTTPTTVPQKTQDKRSSNNLLSSLTINNGSLTPGFDTNISEYEVQLSKDTTSIIVEAKTADNKAKVSGTGEIKVEPGKNEIIITVTAENGSNKEYKINAYVDETPQIYIKYKDKEIGAVRNLKELNIPQGFTETKHSINDYEFTVFNNGNFSILYGINEENEKKFYIFDTEKNECTSKIIPMTIDKCSFYIVDIDAEKEGFEISSTTINEQEVEGYKFKEGFSDYFLLYVMNDKGEMIEYIYEAKENTLQLYGGFAPVTYEQYKDLVHQSDSENQKMVQELYNKKVIIYIISALLVLSIIGYFFIFLKSRKEKSNEEMH